MKRNKILLMFFAITFIHFLIACNSENTSGNSLRNAKESETQALINSGGANAPEAYREGARLVAANDCLTCHKVNDTSVGPSFTSISNRYENIEANVNKLLVSVQKGSSGIWARNTMTPHPNLTPQDGTQMIRYVLSHRTINR
ncbi:MULTISPECIES: c-type cytochrome [Chitinophagaceae]